MTQELHVAVRGLTAVAAGTVMPRLDIVVHRSDGAEIRDEISPVIAIKTGNLYLPPAAINALIMSAAKTFLAAPDGWNLPNAYDAEYLYSGASPAASIQITKKTADSELGALADVPIGASGAAMSFVVMTGRTYHFRFFAPVQASNILADIGMTVSVPAFAVFAATGRMAGADSDGAGGEIQGIITASNDVVSATTILDVDTDVTFAIDGVLVPSSDGTITLRGQNTGVGTATVRRGAVGILWDLGA